MADKPLTVTALSAYFVPAYRGGGPIRTLEALIAEHSDSLDVSVICTNTDLGSPRPIDVPVDSFVSQSGASVYYVNWASILSRLRAIAVIRSLASDFLYINSLFSIWFSIIPLACSKLRFISPQRIVIAPRGELGRGALAISSRKKRVYLLLARRAGLHRSVTWHASSEVEKREIVAHFPGAEVVVRENEVNLPELSLAPMDAPDQDRLSSVYIGRLSPKKGLHLLLIALKEVSLPVSLDIFGEFEDGAYKEQIETLLMGLPPHIIVTLNGPIDHSLVRQTFSKFELFLFPTLHENFGHTIAESLSASCPVMLMDVTPFTHTVASGGGVIVSSSREEDWAAAITHFAGLASEERKKRRVLAGIKYEVWRSFKSEPSVFELVNRAR